MYHDPFDQHFSQMLSGKTLFGHIFLSTAHIYQMENPLKGSKFKDMNVVVDASDTHDTQVLILMISWQIIKKDSR